jgi:hypothetical protein
MFDDCQTIEQIERRKRSLVTELHPDAGGSNERFLAMMDAYDRAIERVKNPVKNEPQETFQAQTDPMPHYGHQMPSQAFYQPSLEDKMNNLFTFIQQGAEIVAKAAVVYTTVMDQLDAIKVEKRKKARKSKKRIT